MSPRWCAKSKDGWCAVVPNRKWSEGKMTVETRCARWIALPWGMEHREPDCPECVKALQKHKPH